MNTLHAERIILIGPTGSGKTTVATEVARLLGWSLLDTDALVERDAGMRIAEVFARDGEAAFRELEAAALAAALSAERVVIATGAGIVERPAQLGAMRAAGWVVALDVSTRTALQRLLAAAPSDVAPGDLRPMLTGTDPLVRLRSLDARRRDAYAQADATCSTEGVTAVEVARQVVAGLAAHGLLPPDGAAAAITTIPSAAGAYTAVVAWGALAALGEHLARLSMPSRLHIVADASVAALYAAPLVARLSAAGFEPAVLTIPAGETSKSRTQWARICDWLAERRAERGEAVVALGGGVTGDLAGFAAATYLRGVPLVHVPTSLLAQVDASIGGKVAIDHPRGKNLIGAFYPPRLVVTDPAALLTLPARQRSEGWAEAIKHGVALDTDYFAALEAGAAALSALRPRETTAAIARSVALKGAIAGGDEREFGPRLWLNYGHTIAHALETVSGYGEWLHGEAVAVGMGVAARMGLRLGITPVELIERQDALLTRFGLPTRLPPVSAEALLHAALWDKKVRGGRVRWVLPSALGHATIADEVPDDVVRAALLEAGAVAEAPAEAGERAHAAPDEEAGG
ncbi:MAG: 3-dehydroquinate synthase [Ktedonobacterales bacterium]